MNSFHFGEEGAGKTEYSNSGIMTFSVCNKLKRVTIIAKHSDGSQRLIFRILFSRKLKTSWGKRNPCSCSTEMVVLMQSFTEYLNLDSSHLDCGKEVAEQHQMRAVLLNYPYWRHFPSWFFREKNFIFPEASCF